tara:strand:+ start:67 stop:741 length:675 start_codon:yes stop_codon:yes gene_type:complete
MFYRITGYLTLFLLLLAIPGTVNITESKAQTKDSKPVNKRPAKIDGFRSAKFGMKDKDVLRAIQKDFKIQKSEVTRGVSSIEQTATLSIEVPKLLPVGGPAKIGYIFGYKSKKLVQVNIAWGKGATKNVDGKSVVDAANFLRTHLIKKQYKKEGFVANARMNDQTTVVFRGKDKKNRMALLVLNVPKANKDENAKTTLKNVSLKLSYLQDAENPDILTIGEDDF